MKPAKFIDEQSAVDSKFVKPERLNGGTNIQSRIGKIMYHIETIYKQGDILFNEMNRQLIIQDGRTIDNVYVELMTREMKITKPDLIDLLREKYSIPYHPIKQYFDNLLDKYQYKDVEGHIINLSSCVHAQNQELFNSMFRKHLIRSVEQGRGGHVNRYVLVLQQEKQRTGKSEFIKYLNPFKNNMYATRLDKDHMLTLSQNFIVNLEELETFTKKDINEIKSIISGDQESIRKLYSQQMENWNRAASFWASTNKDGFLSDVENSRWLPFAINGIDFKYNDWATGEHIDIHKVWAEAAHFWKGKTETEPTAIEWEQIQGLHKKHEYLNEYDHYCREYIEAGDDFQTATQIANHISGKVTSRINPSYVGRALVKMGITQTNEGTKKGYAIQYTDGLQPVPF